MRDTPFQQTASILYPMFLATFFLSVVYTYVYVCCRWLKFYYNRKRCAREELKCIQDVKCDVMMCVRFLPVKSWIVEYQKKRSQSQFTIVIHFVVAFL